MTAGEKMKKNIFLFVIIEILALAYTAAFADEVRHPGDDKQLAGWYCQL